MKDHSEEMKRFESLGYRVLPPIPAKEEEELTFDIGEVALGGLKIVSESDGPALMFVITDHHDSPLAIAALPWEHVGEAAAAIQEALAEREAGQGPAMMNKQQQQAAYRSMAHTLHAFAVRQPGLDKGLPVITVGTNNEFVMTYPDGHVTKLNRDPRLLALMLVQSVRLSIELMLILAGPDAA